MIWCSRNSRVLEIHEVTCQTDACRAVTWRLRCMLFKSLPFMQWNQRVKVETVNWITSTSHVTCIRISSFQATATRQGTFGKIPVIHSFFITRDSANCWSPKATPGLFLSYTNQSGRDWYKRTTCMNIDSNNMFCVMSCCSIIKKQHKKNFIHWQWLHTFAAYQWWCRPSEWAEWSNWRQVDQTASQFCNVINAKSIFLQTGAVEQGNITRTITQRILYTINYAPNFSNAVMFRYNCPRCGDSAHDWIITIVICLSVHIINLCMDRTKNLRNMIPDVSCVLVQGDNFPGSHHHCMIERELFHQTSVCRRDRHYC